MKSRFLALSSLILFLSGCGLNNTDPANSIDTTEELGQQLGEMAATMDESGGSSNGSIASLDFKSSEAAYLRLTESPQSSLAAQKIADVLLPKALAASCSEATFDACSASLTNGRVKTFAACTLGAGTTMTGSVQLLFTGSNAAGCTAPNIADTIARTPAFVITGARGGTFEVSSGSSGQVLTRLGTNTFSFINGGIRRVFTTVTGTTLLDLTTSTSSPVTFTGSSRLNRQITGGAIEIKNNLNDETCSVTPNDVTWTSAACNCPNSGTFTGTCSSGESFSMSLLGTCGRATVTVGDVSKTITMDRCSL